MHKGGVPVLARRGLRADLLSRPIGFGRGGTSRKLRVAADVTSGTRSRLLPMLDNEGGPDSGRERLAFFLGMEPGRGDARRPLAYLGSFAMVVLALGCGLLIERFIGLQSILLVFLMAVIGAAIAWG